MQIPKPYTYADVFDHMVQPALTPLRHDWINLSRDRVYTGPTGDHGEEDYRWYNDTKWWDLSEDDRRLVWDGLSDVEKHSIYTVETCQKACEDDRECLQWWHRPGECHVGHVVRLGHTAVTEKMVKEKEDSNTSSGWMVDRIAEVREKFKGCTPVWDFG